MGKHIKFNFYSTIVKRTLTVEGEKRMNWNTEVFIVNNVYLEKHNPIIASEVQDEAVEYFKINKKNIDNSEHD